MTQPNTEAVDAQIDAAINALTAIAESGADFAEVACHVITAVAANRGSVEALLETRSGSWEADCIRNIVIASAGVDEEVLHAYRTKPISIDLHSEGLADEIGLTTQMEMAIQSLEQQADSLQGELERDVATEGEITELTALREVLRGWVDGSAAVPDQDTVTGVLRRLDEISLAIHDRARRGRDSRPDEIARLRAEMSHVGQLYEADKEAYAQKFKTQVTHQLQQAGLKSVEFVITDSDPSAWLGAPSPSDVSDPFYSLVDGVCAEAIASFGREVEESDYIEKLRTEGHAAK